VFSRSNPLLKDRTSFICSKTYGTEAVIRAKIATISAGLSDLFTRIGSIDLCTNEISSSLVPGGNNATSKH